MTIFGCSFSSSMQKIQIPESKHSLIIQCYSKGHNYMIMNFHLPAGWQSDRFLK